MEGGTVFHFVTGGIHAAFARAKEAAGRRDDELRIAVAPVLLGSGEPLFAGMNATHYVRQRR